MAMLQVTLCASRLATLRKHITMRIHLVPQALRACVTQAVIIGNGLKHIEPHRPLFAFEVSWLEFDAIKRSNSAA